jgi:septal ring factor EnvC (AmiA/AmiB activator)
MIDAAFSHERQRADRTAVGVRQLWIFAVALAVILSGLGFAVLQRGSGGNGAAALASTTAPPREQVSNELLETTKGLQMTQQQAVDQLQVVQDQLAAQKAETKRLSEQIAAVTEKLDALKQSVADAPAPSVAAPVSPPKSRHQ